MTRKRSSYRPKPVNFQAHSMVTERVTPIRDNTRVMTALQVKNHLALTRICSGQGDNEDAKALIYALNIAVALPLVAPRLGEDWLPEVKQALGYICDMVERSKKLEGRFVFKAEELAAINLAMDVHDTQLAACYGIEMEGAVNFVHKALKLEAMKELELGGKHG